MELRIKILYITTIIAILAFLGMQVYWLYGRYEYSLRQYEDEAYRTAMQVINDYRIFRLGLIQHPGLELTHQSTYNITTNEDSLYRTKRTATFKSSKYYAHKLLGINEKRPLTDEEKLRAALIVNENLSKADTIMESFDVSHAPTEAAVWAAFKNMELEFLSPFNICHFDSLLHNAGLNSRLHLFTTDSIVWSPALIRHTGLLPTSAIVTIPYSEMECKSISIECLFSPAEIIGKMFSSLVIVIFLSLFLILCLILQISTVLKLSRLDKMRNSFITTMIHELKRPISTLKMCVSGIENARLMSDPAVKHELVSETRTALDNLSAYFSKLRDITFNNVEQIPLNITSLNLNRLFSTVSRSIIIPADKQVNIINDIDPDLEIAADASHLYNILNNLVENAVKYSGDSIEIRASATLTDSEVSISISDNGNGISTSDLRHIFRRFYRGKASATDLPGMGLGLTYVQLLVGAHGGTVTVDSTEGVGTCFTINLPR
ncbi:MAG: HAMP domain-containing histidine kinase [Muribaculaceae bacterium]|nr:HAMP domain-containing histidine kinase [Muribaculaceae bacterium]